MEFRYRFEGGLHGTSKIHAKSTYLQILAAHLLYCRDSSIVPLTLQSASVDDVDGLFVFMRAAKIFQHTKTFCPTLFYVGDFSGEDGAS